MDFSVLMSVYIRENPIYLDEALKSILIDQTIIPNELVIVEDGPLTKELELVIEEYKKKFDSIIKLIKLSENHGLGRDLNIGLNECTYELVARMDSDDICHRLRFEKQLKVFRKNNNVDLVGSNIAEFFESRDNIEFIRKVPSSMDEIQKMSKKRNPVNHVSVMFKKSSVLNAGGYKHMLYLEDYYLWIRMIKNNNILQNIDEELVYVRTGEEMFKRRSNTKYITSWYYLQKKMYEYDMVNWNEFVLNMANIISFILIPPSIKKYIYKYFLRDR